MQKRRSARVIQQIEDENGHMHRSSEKIMEVFATYFGRKYEFIAVDEDSISAMVRMATSAPRPTYEETLERPIDADEIRHHLRVGGRNKTPGSDCIGL
jgi:hypothetical protein